MEGVHRQSSELISWPAADWKVGEGLFPTSLEIVLSLHLGEPKIPLSLRLDLVLSVSGCKQAQRSAIS